MARLAIIHFIDGRGDSGEGPDNSLPTIPVLPGQLPSFGGGSGNRPDNSLPPGVATLPVFPFDPTVPPPTTGEPPTTKPIVPGRKFVVKWLACTGLILVPDNSLPDTTPTPTPV